MSIPLAKLLVNSSESHTDSVSIPLAKLLVNSSESPIDSVSTLFSLITDVMSIQKVEFISPYPLISYYFLAIWF